MGKPKTAVDETPNLSVRDQQAWEKWLEKNHDKSAGVWLQIAKKGAALQTPTYAEAIDVTLCFGWIDGQKGKKDDCSWLQRFTRRGAKSIWSKINVDKVGRLIADGKIRPAGLAAVASAKLDGRWKNAYAGQKTATVPDDLMHALDGNAQAKAFFAMLDRGNRYAIVFRLATAKRAETRQRRIVQFVEMLARHEKLHP